MTKSLRRKAVPRGTTLIELLIMSLVALVLVAVIWVLFSGGLRHFAKTDTKLKGLQGALLLVEHLQDDLDRLCWDESHPIGNAGQEGRESEDEVSFFIYDRRAKPGKLRPNPTVLPVTYKFEKATHKVLRNDVAFTFGHFVHVRFKLEAGNRKDPFNPEHRDHADGRPGSWEKLHDGAHGEVPPGDGARGEHAQNLLLYWIAAASDEKIAQLEEEIRNEPSPQPPADGADGHERPPEWLQGEHHVEERKGITRLSGAVHLKSKTMADQFPGWVENGPDAALTGSAK